MTRLHVLSAIRKHGALFMEDRRLRDEGSLNGTGVTGLFNTGDLVNHDIFRHGISRHSEVPGLSLRDALARIGSGDHNVAVRTGHGCGRGRVERAASRVVYAACQNVVGVLGGIRQQHRVRRRSDLHVEHLEVGLRRTEVVQVERVRAHHEHEGATSQRLHIDALQGHAPWILGGPFFGRRIVQRWVLRVIQCAAEMQGLGCIDHRKASLGIPHHERDHRNVLVHGVEACFSKRRGQCVGRHVDTTGMRERTQGRGHDGHQDHHDRDHHQKLGKRHPASHPLLFRGLTHARAPMHK